MNENYNFFCDRVCSYIDHATEKEKRQIHKELSDHIEDHAQALIEMGRTPEEAHAAAIVAMGDPEEIGREMNKQYPYIWLFLSRATAVVAIILALLLLSPIRDMANRVSDNLSARNRPMEVWGEYGESIDIRVELPENDIAYFYSRDIGQMDNGKYLALIGVCAYDDNPFGRVSKNALNFRLELKDGFFQPTAGGFLGYATQHKRMSIEVEKLQDSVELCYSHMGEVIWVEIPLNWEGVE